MEAIPENDSQGSGSATPDSQPVVSGATGGFTPSGSESATPAPAQSAMAPESLGEEDPHARLTEILIRISGAEPAQIRPEARLIEDIGIDSLGFYEILIEADECLGIKIREEDLLKFRTVGDIQNYLRKMHTPDAQAN